MKGKTRKWIVVGGVLFTALALCAVLLWARDAYHQAPGLREVLAWLPEDTETVLGSRSFDLSDLASGKDGPKRQTLSFAVWCAGVVQDDSPVKGLRGALCVEGSRNFRPSKSLGMMPFDGACILVLEKRLPFLGYAFQRSLERAAKSVRWVAWHRVAVYEKLLESDTWTFLVAVPYSDVIVVATEEAYLREVLEGIDHSRPRGPLPEFLEDGLRRVGNAPVFGIRRFLSGRAATDPTSPLNSTSYEGSPDPKATGLVFSCDPDSSTEVKVTYLSESENALELVKKLWVHPGDKLKPGFRTAGPGAVEIAVPVNDPGLSMFFFVLLHALGHGIAV